MFTDVRSKKIIFVSHCTLNQNSISDGTADYPGTNEGVLKLLMQSGAGIVQLPCPELMCLGLDRGDIHGGEREVVAENSRIRGQLERPESMERMDRLTEQVTYQMEEYLKNGFTILGIIGINRSPSCGVETTSRNDREVAGEGVFMEALRKAMERKGLHIPMIGIKATETDCALEAIEGVIARH